MTFCFSLIIKVVFKSHTGSLGWWSQQPANQCHRCWLMGTDLGGQIVLLWQCKSNLFRLDQKEVRPLRFSQFEISLLDVSCPSWAWTQCSSSIVSFSESLSVRMRYGGTQRESVWISDTENNREIVKDLDRKVLKCSILKCQQNLSYVNHLATTLVATWL